jgi:hypothetical protein
MCRPDDGRPPAAARSRSCARRFGPIVGGYWPSSLPLPIPVRGPPVHGTSGRKGLPVTPLSHRVGRWPAYRFRADRFATRFVLGMRRAKLDHTGSLMVAMPPEPAAVPVYGLSGLLGATTLFVPKPAAPGLVGPVGVPPEPPAVLVPKGGDVRLVTCANAIDSLEANKASVKTTRLQYTLKIFSHVPVQRVDDC